MQTAQALYGLHVDAFIEGIAEEAPVAEEFGLTEVEAREVRRQLHSEKIAEQRKGKAAA